MMEEKMSFSDQNVRAPLNLDLINPEELLNWLFEHDEPEQADVSPVNSEAGEESTRVKVSKNDIRRFLPKMFQHTINAGHFRYAQSFCDSFIAQNCKLTATFNLPAQFHVPASIQAEGPLQFSHFVLGYLLMFPDIVLTIVESSIHKTSVGGTGSSIVMTVDFSLTKTAHIPFELWVPPMDLLESLYRASTGWQLLHVVRHANRYRSPTNGAPLPTSSSEDLNGTGPSILLPGEETLPSPSPPPPEALPKRVPERYAKALHQAAVPVYSPLPLRLRGQLVFHLNELNHIVQMDMNVGAV